MSRAYVLAAIVISVSFLSLAVFAEEWPRNGQIQPAMNKKLGRFVRGGNYAVKIHLASAGNETTPNPNPPPQSTKRGEFLLAHNKVRTPFKVPLLTWDKKLTRFARRWAKKRAADCKMIHSYGPYGENLFWGKRDHWTPSEVVESWAGENKFYNLQSNECAAGQMCGHYTQIIWKESVRLGCVRVNCVNGELLVICEYDPPGNYVNERPV